MKNKSSKNAKTKSDNVQNFERVFADFSQGLSEVDVELRRHLKMTNETKVKASKSYLSIFIKNIFTFFNLIWLGIAIALICVKAYNNLTCIIVAALNTIIAIIQECRAKHAVAKLSMSTASKVKVIRQGMLQEIYAEDIVLDDIIILENGDQVPADCQIVNGQVEVNESMLTGESNSIRKKEQAQLLSGSFLVSGRCHARVVKVGKDNHIYQLAQKAKEFKAPKSNLFKDLNRMIKFISIALIPIGILTFVKEFMVPESSAQEWVVKTCGVLAGMIPAGMYLLVSVGLAVGVIKLAKKNTLVRDLYSIEMLARTNVLCLDKTGTITDGTMKVVDFKAYNKFTKKKAEKLLQSILFNQKATNATSKALAEHFGKNEKVTALHTLEFSSERKYSITELEKNKLYFLGAATKIGCVLTKDQKAFIEKAANKGYRVLAISVLEGKFSEKASGKNSKVIALIVLEEHIRENAIETIKWFENNGVKIKIISGDDPMTVAKIAQRVGVESADKFISLDGVSLDDVANLTDYTVFGRVSPEQKYAIIKALKNNGNVVAMTGDGVNDTLALKEADCSIAMADGSEAARGISSLVLKECDFTALPQVVKEGRQVVNNVQNSASLFVMKTLFAMLLSLATICMWTTYPLEPIYLQLLEMFVIGIPSFILTFEPNTSQIKGNFLPNVIKKSLPRALVLFIAALILVIINENGLLILEEYQSLLVLVITFAGYLNLITLCLPLKPVRIITLTLSLALVVCAMFAVGKFFMITSYSSMVLSIFFGIIGGLATIIAAVMVGRCIFKKIYTNKRIDRSIA